MTTFQGNMRQTKDQQHVLLVIGESLHLRLDPANVQIASLVPSTPTMAVLCASTVPLVSLLIGRGRISKPITGKHADVRGALECTTCVRGKYAANEGRRNCKDCEVGKFSLGGGLSYCTDCGGGAWFSNLLSLK